jgi:uracil-DNA glycosylase
VSLYNPCIKSVGPKNARVMAIGEAPGEQEEYSGIPFFGPAGQEFDRLLEEAGFKRSELYLTNVLRTRPPFNKMEAVCVKKKDLPGSYSLPPLSQGKYLHPDLVPELDRLRSEIDEVKPWLILSLGNTALWGVLGQTGISRLRGTIQPGPGGCKVLPTYHPSAVLRQWDLRPIVSTDFCKARAESLFPEIRRPRRELLINPTLDELRAAYNRGAQEAKILATDVETKRGQITCCSFSWRKDFGVVIPFVDLRQSDRSFWRSLGEECQAWLLVQEFLALPVPKLFQNGLYDIQYYRKHGLHIENPLHDTMLLHHSMYPEMLKGLGFLGSVYTNEASWKLLRQRSDDELKREE